MGAVCVEVLRIEMPVLDTDIALALGFLIGTGTGLLFVG